MRKKTWKHSDQLNNHNQWIEWKTSHSFTLHMRRAHTLPMHKMTAECVLILSFLSLSVMDHKNTTNNRKYKSSQEWCINQMFWVCVSDGLHLSEDSSFIHIYFSKLEKEIEKVSMHAPKSHLKCTLDFNLFSSHSRYLIFWAIWFRLSL